MSDLDTAGSGSADTNLVIPATHGKYHQEAWLMLSLGEKPTADALLQRLGGQKQTAVAALRTFWSEFVRSKVTGHHEGDVPQVVLELAGNVWQLAKRVGQANADERVADRRQRLDELEADLVLRESAVVDAASRLKNREIKLVEARQANEVLLADLKSAREALHKQIDRESSRADSLDMALTQERARHDETRDALAKASISLGVGSRDLAERDRDLHRRTEKLKAVQQAHQDTQAALEFSRDNVRTLQLEAEGLKQKLEQTIAAHKMAMTSAAETQGQAISYVRAEHDAELSRWTARHFEAELALQLEVRRLEDEVTRLSRNAEKKSSPARVRASPRARD